jgi:hypothetical protein
MQTFIDYIPALWRQLGVVHIWRHHRGGGGGFQMMTIDDGGEGGVSAHDDVIKNFQIFTKFS